MTLCPACFNAVAAVRPAIPAPMMRIFSCMALSLEPMVIGPICVVFLRTLVQNSDTAGVLTV